MVRLALLVGLYAAFVLANLWCSTSRYVVRSTPVNDRVVIAAHILVGIYGGDRFLASNIEAIRLAATGLENGHSHTDYLIRAQHVVAKLNPCHEDNYYLANGLLTWGGAVNEGNKVLEAAIACRTWDFVPPFFYGVNLAFFQRDIPAAQQALETAAQRSPVNATGLRKLAVMLQAESYVDEHMALDYLIQQRDGTADQALRGMLDKRVVRLQGLLALRDAQRRYEQQTGNVLTAPSQLIESGFIQAFPEDPLRLGYEFVNGTFKLKQLKIAGFENN